MSDQPPDAPPPPDALPPAPAPTPGVFAPGPAPAPIPGVLTRGPAAASSAMADFNQLLRQQTPLVWVTWLIVVANVAVFAIMLASGVDPLEPKVMDLVRWGGNFGPMTTHGEPWRLASAMFLHAGILHIALNMIVLIDIGRFMERLAGPAGFLGAYLAAGLAGSIASAMFIGDRVSVGASGAIFGLFGAMFGFLVRARGSIPDAVVKRLMRSGGFFLVINVVGSAQIANIDHAAHFGGLAGGFLAGLMLARPIDAAGLHLRGKRALASFGLVAVLAAAGAFALPGKTGFGNDFQSAFAEEPKLLTRFQTEVGRMQAGELTGEQVATTIETEILPAWRAMEVKVAKLRGGNPVASRLAALGKRYVVVRREWLELLVKGLRGDLEAMTGAKAKLDESQDLLGQMQQANK